MDAAHNGEGSATREREAVMQQPAGTREARRELRGLIRGQERGLDERGAVQCERRWHDKRGGDVTTSRHEQGVA